MLSCSYTSRVEYAHINLLVHAGDQVVDEFLTRTPVSATLLTESVALADEATLWCGELERPEEVVCLLELRADGIDLVDQILDTLNAVLGELVADDLVVGERDALLVDLTETAL